ncbi:MAG: hypothetical protein GW823_01310 [Bacteroidetes bacterium]|nr:hypothetical protein [Bacteroidota bacterium]
MIVHKTLWFFSQAIIFSISLFSNLFAQENFSRTMYVAGTQLVSVSNYEFDSPSSSFHVGVGKYWYFGDSTITMNSNIKNIKLYGLLTVSLDRFSESNFYKYSSQNDRIDYSRIAINGELQWSIIEFKWPTFINLFVLGGISYSTSFFIQNNFGDEVIKTESSIRNLNGFYGLSFNAKLINSITMTVSWEDYLLSNFQIQDDLKFPKMLSRDNRNMNVLKVGLRYYL